MHFFNDDVNSILLEASKFTNKENHRYITLLHLYCVSITNEKIKEILSYSGVDQSKLLEVLQDKVHSLPPKDPNDKSKLLLSVVVENFLSICGRDAEIRKNTINKLSLDIEKYYEADEVVFFISFLLNCLYEDESEVHEIAMFTLDSSNKKNKKELFESMLKRSKSLLDKEFSSYVDDLKKEKEEIELSNKQEGGYEFYQMEDMHNNSEKSKKSSLESFSQNMNSLYEKNQLEKYIYGRDSEISEIVNILSKKKKCNPLMVGDDGVGKTVIIDKLVSLIMSDNPPASLKDKVIYRLDINSLVAGTKYRGDFESRISELLKEIKSDKNAIIWIDDIHNIFHAGSTGAGSSDLASLLIPALSSNDMKCIGSTTTEVHSRVFSKMPAFSRRFQKVVINEPTIEEMHLIIRKAKESYEEHHMVSYSEGILDLILSLSDRYLHGINFPDKAFDILDTTGAKYSSGELIGNEVKVEDVVSVISKRANVKIATEEEDKKLLSNLNKDLKNRVFGQDVAADKLVDVIHVAKAGLNNNNKPYGSFLFLGPTGVGKTEIVKNLAESLSMKLHRFDMSEFMEKHSVSKLFGSPPGYVGNDSGGQLTEALYKEPYSIVLFDEIEKAHPDISNALLQILDNGFMTDSNGKKVSFRNAIIVMTSNLGVKDSQLKKDIGFGTTQIDNSLSFNVEKDELNRAFSPEFINRLSAVIPFDYLSNEVILKVVDKFLKELSETLDSKNISMSVTNSAKKLLASQGYDKLMGARPMERIIYEEIRRPISKEILFGKLKNGGCVKLTSKNNKFEISFENEL
jgi:ATP-dependent Clp protease ATP-binding subunit ClpA